MQSVLADTLKSLKKNLSTFPVGYVRDGICKYCEKVSICPYICNISVFRLARLRSSDLFQEVCIASGRSYHSAHGFRHVVLLREGWPFEQCVFLRGVIGQRILENARRQAEYLWF